MEGGMEVDHRPRQPIGYNKYSREQNQNICNLQVGQPRTKDW